MEVRSSLSAAISAVKDSVAVERQLDGKGKPNVIFRSPLRDYCVNFVPLLNGTSLIGPDYPEDLLANFVCKISDRRVNPYVLDVFADETVVRELVDDYGFAGGVAMALALKPKPLDKSEYKQTGLVTGNVLRRSTWRSLTDKMKELDIPIFDLIISRGEGALVGLTDNPYVHYFLLQELWQRLNPDGGVMLLQIPHTKGMNLEDWAANVRKLGVPTGIGDDGLFPVAMMTRLPHSPRQFPRISV